MFIIITGSWVNLLLYFQSIYYNHCPPLLAQVDLYTQRYPYDDTTRQEFDPSLGPHDAFIIVDRYIFAQVCHNYSPERLISF